MRLLLIGLMFISLFSTSAKAQLLTDKYEIFAQIPLKDPNHPLAIWMFVYGNTQTPIQRDQNSFIQTNGVSAPPAFRVLVQLVNGLTNIGTVTHYEFDEFQGPQDYRLKMNIEVDLPANNGKVEKNSYDVDFTYRPTEQVTRFRNAEHRNSLRDFFRQPNVSTTALKQGSPSTPAEPFDLRRLQRMRAYTFVPMDLVRLQFGNYGLNPATFESIVQEQKADYQRIVGPVSTTLIIEVIFTTPGLTTRKPTAVVVTTEVAGMDRFQVAKGVPTSQARIYNPQGKLMTQTELCALYIPSL